MCAILDANCFNDFFSRHEDFAPVHKWIDQKNGKFVYSPTEKFKSEWNGENKRRYLEEKRRRGVFVLREVDKKIVNVMTRKWEKSSKNKKIKSNDPHIIALAEASGAKILISRDRKLGEDFKEIIGGSIYKNKNHAHLLKPDTCP